MKAFMPDRVYFEPTSLNYPLGHKLLHFFEEHHIPIIRMKDNRVTGIPGDTQQEKYIHAKRTLVVSTKKTLDFDVCKPSADYQFPLATSCPGNCEYCYLQTTQGKRPYIRVYVNLEEIFERIKKHIKKRLPDITTFEGASTSDPLALEHITGTLKEAIEYFGTLTHGRLRIVSKYDTVDSLVKAKHQGHTRFRFSINASYVIDQFEHGTAPLADRIEAASKIAGAEYPTGFIIAPIMVFDGWKAQYRSLMDGLASHESILANQGLSFELIQHRYTHSARNLIHQRFPKTRLDMDDSKRLRKWGRYGMYKYVYPKDLSTEMDVFIRQLIGERFPNAVIEYFT